MIPSVPSEPLPAEQRVAKRHSLRSMDTFLNFDFAPRKRLRLVDHHVHGISIQALKATHASWTDRLTWHRSLNLRHVCGYISTHAPQWAVTLGDDEGNLLKLENLLATLERVVVAYNQRMLKRNPGAEPINYINPLRRILRLQVCYPESLNPQQMKTVKHDISYDRLTSSEELTKQMKEFLGKPISVTFLGDKDLNSGNKLQYSLNAVPSHIFKNMLQHPEVLDNPATESVKSNIQVIDIVFSNADWSSIAANLHTKGQSEGMPRVYEQGVADGKVKGYQEAIGALIAGFNKAVSSN